jgi:hypothetical protein
MSSIILVLRTLRSGRPEALEGRRTAASEIVPAAILRDAVLRTAPQDEIRGFRVYAHDLIGFMESIY